MRIRAKEIHRARKREEDRLHEKIKSLRTVKPATASRTPVRGGRPATTKAPGAPRAPRSRPAPPTD